MNELAKTPGSEAAADLLRVSDADCVRRIELANPPANALSRAMIAALQAAFDAARDDADVRVIVLGAAPGKVFCAGHDLKEMTARRKDADRGRAFFETTMAECAMLMQSIVRHIGQDERRHMAWGTYTCRRLVAADASLWQVVEDTMGELLPQALEAIGFLSQYDQPLGLNVEDFVTYAAERATRRLGAISAALGQDVAQVEADDAPVALEDELAST